MDVGFEFWVEMFEEEDWEVLQEEGQESRCERIEREVLGCGVFVRSN